MKNAILVLVFGSLFSLTAISDTYSVEVVKGRKVKTISKKGLKKKRSRRGIKVSKKVKKLNKSKSPWGVSLGYGFNTNLADDNSRRVFNHSISTGLSYSLKKSWNFSTGFGFGYRSVEQDIDVDQKKSEDLLNDIGLSAGRSFKILKRTRLGLSLSNTFPTSPYSQVEGIKAIPSVGLNLSTPYFKKKLRLSTSAGAHALIHSNSHSVASGKVNKATGFSYRLGASVSLFKGASFSVGSGARFSNYIDGTTTLSFSNSASISYSLAGVSMSVYTSNGGFAERDEFSLWYIDEYRRLVGLSLGTSF